MEMISDAASKKSRIFFVPTYLPKILILSTYGKEILLCTIESYP
jgi:hypothetical protein